jgi:hypothetical protein
MLGPLITLAIIFLLTATAFGGDREAGILAAVFITAIFIIYLIISVARSGGARRY